MRNSTKALAASIVTLVTLSGCGSNSPVPTDSGIGALHGRVGPGAPPDGKVPAELEMLFQSGDKEVRTTARNGEYEIELPVGTYSVRTIDNLACANNVVVQGAIRLRQDLIYPGDCR